MQILKTFIGPSGVKHKPGDKAPADWDKSRINHYVRHGMVGNPPKAPRKTPGPSENKPATPSETKSPAQSDTASVDPAADTSGKTAGA